ncbi:heavy-metal resistance [Methylobacterium symbioticum]|uniref:Heavy-metal resistance n=1 Tax=Methylobacterium symbioticum TaxID=2584084 RepID=A0A509EHH9_9HYPH|nr:heavy-metal resistance [Methylobacterium symbioticum]VUD72909.1 hypothetical protein MET9862_03516 [Methylobacterium symbioticum]
MSSPADKSDPFDPLGIAAAMGEWCCLLKAAQELRNVDAEMMDTLLEANAAGPTPLGPEAAAKVRAIANLMRSLNLDPEAIRRREPETMMKLEAACLGCTERGRCARELWAGSAAGTYHEFCPNAARIDRLRRA